jgi:dihydrofolate synthase/folylpolyglutamate synthase
MNYADTLQYLSELGKFGSHLGLERIQGLLEELDHPEKRFKTIHVTGTNGKGSVCEFLSNILIASGLKVGTYTSPHFVKYNERITVNGTDISDETFAQLATEVAGAEERFKKRGGTQPTQFEVLTAMCFLHFAREKIDYGVIEVGMGGLWDSTNVIMPEVSVITNVTLEHTAVLGKTVAAISTQKAGIIKQNVPVVTAAWDEALQVIEEKAKETNSSLYVLGKDFSAQELKFNTEEQTFSFSSAGLKQDFTITLLGEHQIINAALAVMTAELLRKKDKSITEKNIKQGLYATKWPGRLEKIADKPAVILDGAHNPSGITVLRKALDKYYPKGKRFFVFGMMKDKDIKTVVNILFRPQDTIFTVPADDGPRAAQPEELQAAIGAHSTVRHEIRAAYQEALFHAGTEDVIIICGSLYLVGSFKAMEQKG